MSEPILPDAVWDEPPRPDAVRYVTVIDDDLGCIAEATTPDGQRLYGVDLSRSESQRQWLDDMCRIQDSINQALRRLEMIQRTCGFDGR